jgi:hypothetical protein
MSKRNLTLVVGVLFVALAVGLLLHQRQRGSETPVPSKDGAVTTGNTTQVTDAPAATKEGAAAPHAGVATPGKPGATAAAPATVADDSPRCFTVTYKHKSAPGHSDADSCAQHRNLIRLVPPAGARVNPGSVCVRVDGTPARFKAGKQAGTFVVAAAAGPDSKITARYCVGKYDCNEDCKVPKDPFLEAIGGNDAEGEETAEGAKKGRAVAWDESEAPVADVADELDGDLRKELAGEAESSVYEGWVGDGALPACGSKVAARN